MGNHRQLGRAKEKIWGRLGHWWTFLCQQQQASHTGIPPLLLGRETLLERVPLSICRLGWVGGRRERGERGVDTRSGGEASRVLNVGGDGGSRVQKR